MKEFNTTGICVPEKHYMVDISERVAEIKKMVDAGKYFVINRGRQYGKTTTLNELEKGLGRDYCVLSLDFQVLSAAAFETEDAFVRGMCRILCDTYEYGGSEIIPRETYGQLRNLQDGDNGSLKLDELFRILMKWCGTSEKLLVLMIDEVDSASNNQVFLDFLAQLRYLYLRREKISSFRTFQSVILAGVTDIRHLKGKIREEEQAKVNSPWNIAADFNIDMSLSEEGIRGMLEEYEADHCTGMDCAELAKLLRDYTEGYPFLVSRLCQLMDTVVKTKSGNVWNKEGFEEAVKLILSENNTLFQSLTKNLNNNPKLLGYVREVLMEGKRIPYSAQQDDIAQLSQYGFVRNVNNAVRISNRIFETMLYNLFLSDEELKRSAFFTVGDTYRDRFTEGGKLNMRLILERFIETYTEIFGPLKDRFKEKDGRECFLLYLRPIINGTGNYYIEAQTRDQSRTDVIVDYLGQQYVIELKIWRGERYNEEGEKQISRYLDYFGLDTGYMLSFNFNQKKEVGVKRITVGEKTLFEGML